jgi:putative ABC transport system permease protein
MLGLHRTLSLGYLSQHRTRSMLVVLSIALGVATLVATQSLNRGLGAAAQNATNPLGGLADLLITNGQAGVRRELATELLADKSALEVQDAQPVVMERIVLRELKDRSVWLFGLDRSRGLSRKESRAGDNPWGATVEWTVKPKDRKELLELARNLWRFPKVLVGKALAHELAGRRGKKDPTVTIRVAGADRNLFPVGTIRFDPTKYPVGDGVLVLDLPEASALVYPQRPHLVTQIAVQVKDGADLEEVRQRIKHYLLEKEEPAQVQTLEANRQMVSDVTAGLELGFAIGGVVALVIGLFLVFNALSVSVAERRHDIGILRAVGATRTQIAGLFVGEAGVLGLTGSLLGLPLGYGLAWLAIKPLGKVLSELLVPIESARIDVSPRLMLAALFSGTLVAILASLVPALQAAREEPADAVRRVPRRGGLAIFALQLSVIVLFVGAGYLCVLFRDYLPQRVGAFGGIVCLLLGALVASPLLSAGFSRVVQPLFRHLFGLEGRLAADNMVRAPGRTGLVIAALAATGGLMVLTAGFLRSTEHAIHDWVENRISADLFVTSGSSASSASMSMPMKEGMGEQLRKVPGVEAVLPVRLHRVDFNNRIVFMLAVDTGTFDHAAKDRPLARTLTPQIVAQLKKPGRVLVSENFAAQHNVRVGDRFEVPGCAHAKLELEVLGTYLDYTWNRGTILVDRDWFRREFKDSLVDIFDVYVRADADALAVKKAIEGRWSKQEAVVVETRSGLQEAVSSQLKRVYGMAYAQQIVVGMVALLGVVSALFISVLQRRRELGLLRAVGASRAQVLRSVLAEAVLMGLIGAVVGFFIGLLLEWYVLDLMLLEEAGFIFPLKVPWLQAGLVSLLSVVFATLAGLWPAYHATQLRIPEAIAYE